MRLNTAHTGRVATREKKDAEVGHSESTNLRISESTNQRIYESANLRISESTNQRIYESANLRISESTNQRIYESANLRISESTNQRIYESANLRISESTNQRIYESANGVRTDFGWLGGVRLFVYSSIRLFAQYPPAHCAESILVPLAFGPLRFQAE